MLGPQDFLQYGQQRGELTPRSCRIPRLPRAGGEVGAGGQSVRVLGAENPLEDGQQRGELVAGSGRVPGLSGTGSAAK